MLDYKALRELLDRPEFATLDDANAALAVNAASDGTHILPMRCGDFANWLGYRGLLSGVVAAQNHASPQIASAAMLLIMKINGDPDRIMDPSDVTIQGLFQAFIAVGIVSQSDLENFTKACTVPTRLLSTIGWPDITDNDVKHARSL